MLRFYKWQVNIDLLILKGFKPNMYKEMPKLDSKNCFLMSNIFLKTKPKYLKERPYLKNRNNELNKWENIHL